MDWPDFGRLIAPLKGVDLAVGMAVPLFDGCFRSMSFMSGHSLR